MKVVSEGVNWSYIIRAEKSHQVIYVCAQEPCTLHIVLRTAHLKNPAATAQRFIWSSILIPPNVSGSAEAEHEGEVHPLSRMWYSWAELVE